MSQFTEGGMIRKGDSLDIRGGRRIRNMRIRELRGRSIKACFSSRECFPYDKVWISNTSERSP